MAAPQPNRPNGERIIEFTNSEIIAAPLFLTLTNLSDSAKTLNVNVSGPGKISFSADQEILMGPVIVFNFPPDVTEAAGLPSVALLTGRTVLTFDSAGNLTSISHVGTVQDLCAALQ